MTNEEKPTFHGPEDETKLIDLIKSIIKRRAGILGIMILSSLASLAYAALIPTEYTAQAGFLEPAETNIPKALEILNIRKRETTEVSRGRGRNKKFQLMPHNQYYSETAKTLYYKFSTLIHSFAHYKKVFDGGNFANKFSNGTTDSDGIVAAIHDSVATYRNEEVLALEQPFREHPIIISMRAEDSEMLLVFMDTLIRETENTVKNQVLSDINTKLDGTLKYNKTELSELIFRKRQSRMETKKMLEGHRDLLLLNLEESVLTAKNLGIIESNFDKFLPELPNFPNSYINFNALEMTTKGGSRHVDKFPLARGEEVSKNIDPSTLKTYPPPLWFIFGAKALSEEIRHLQKRSKLYIKLRLLDSRNKFEQKRNQRIDLLKEEISLLKMAKKNQIELNIVSVSQPSTLKAIEPNRFKIMILGLLIGLFISLLYIFIGLKMDSEKIN